MAETKFVDDAIYYQEKLLRLQEDYYFTKESYEQCCEANKHLWKRIRKLKKKLKKAKRKSK